MSGQAVRTSAGWVAFAPVLALALILALAGCGKKGAPQPPGPPDQIIYPRTYPTH